MSIDYEVVTCYCCGGWFEINEIWCWM